MAVSITAGGLEIDGREVPLYSGAVHYWRIDREVWATVLDRIAEMGFGFIETYVPWSVHEYAPGQYDFGTVDRKKDLDAFLKLCEEKKLGVLIRPGPHINAELTLFGFPEWILYDEEIQARTPWQTPVIYPYFTKQFPIPSYASEKFYLKVKTYFEKLAPILKKHQNPEGCIIAVQADNETCYFFRDRPYVMDYSRDSVSLYRSMLKEKYGSIEKLEEAYGVKAGGFDEISPPAGFRGKDFKDLPYYFDWVEYKEYQIQYALRRMIEMIRAIGIKVPVFHNCAFQHYTPVNVHASEKIPGMSVVGIDAYADPDDSRMLKKRIRYLAGTSALPFVPEFGSGSWFDRGTLLSPGEEEFSILYAFMNGLKAVNYYMLVERDRWTGCPITRKGKRRKEYFDLFCRLNRFLKETQLFRFQRTPGVLVAKNYCSGRLKALLSSLDLSGFSSNRLMRGPEFPALLFQPENGLNLKYFDGDVAHWSNETWIDCISETLSDAQVDFNYSDLNLTLEELCRYPVVFASAYDFMGEQDQKKLIRYAEQGGELVIGPGVPYLNEKFKPCAILRDRLSKSDVASPIGKGSIRLLPDGSELDADPLRKLCDYRSDNRSVEITVHHRGTRCLLFAANVSSAPEGMALSFRGKRKFTGKWNAADMAGEDQVRALLKPYSVSVWETVEKAES